MYRDKKGLHTSNDEDSGFGGAFLTEIVEYIADNFTPDELYSDETICEAARDHMEDFYDPEDVFESDKLSAWATENGYVLAEA